MKFTICVTQRCNLACEYCSMGKGDATMSPAVGRSVVSWIFECVPPDEKIEIDFSGGEPFLELTALQELTDLIERHPAFEPGRVELTVVSNGTIFSDEIAAFLREHEIRLTLSCDGAPAVQDHFRRFADGQGSSKVVERTARAALEALGSVSMSAVYRPETLRSLPEVVEYLAVVGFREINLEPDYSAAWSEADADALPDVYGAVADRYVKSRLRGAPLSVSLVDGKIALLLRGGYQPADRCRMGAAGFAFSPDGRVYPCARLIGCGSGSAHRMGDVKRDLVANRCQNACQRNAPQSCGGCELLNYCMNWCGSSNYLSTGDHDQVGAFLCASERASVSAAGWAFDTLEARLGQSFASSRPADCRPALLLLDDAARDASP